jgi:phosphoenolpyruvate carboxylase
MATTKKNSTRLSKTMDKDAPLKEDIRLLGRLLGDVIRHQEGDAVYEIVETIRQTAVRFRRESDPEAGTDLDRLLKKLTSQSSSSLSPAGWFSCTSWQLSCHFI